MRNQNYNEPESQRERGRIDRVNRFQPERERAYGRDPDYYAQSNPVRSGYNDFELTSRYGDYGPPRRYDNSAYRDYSNYGRDEFTYRRGEYDPYRSGRPQYSHIRCRDIMTTDVTTTTPEANLHEVAKLMRDEDVGAIPVMEDGKLKGIVTDRDIVVRGLADKDKSIQNLSVKDVMSDDVYTVKPNDRLVDAIRKMGDKQVRRILVVDGSDKLRGIISMADVALEANQDRELADALEDISEHKSWFSRLFSW